MRHLAVAILILFTFKTASADTWLPPKVTDYYSSDSTYFVRVVPRCVPDKYYKWLNASEKRKRKFSPKDTTIVPSHAMMFKRTTNGDSLIWKEKLINQIAPVDALVSDDGEYFVTFDNWHSMGYGVDVLAIYDEKGMLLKRHMLEDISPFPINTYERSVSSIWWRCGQEFVNDNEIEICFNNEEKEPVSRIYNIEELKIKENTP